MLKNFLIFASVFAFSFQVHAGKTPIKASDGDDFDNHTTHRSLIFLDQGQEPDMLDFLAKKYSTLSPKTKETFLEMKREAVRDVMGLVTELRPYAMTVKDYTEARLENLVSQRLTQDNPAYLTPAEEKRALSSYFRNNRSQMEERYQLAQQNSNRSYLDDVVLGAHWIKSLRQKHGEFPVVFLGRTPCFLQVAYEELCKNASPDNPNCCDHIYHLSFSGSPDIENTRTDSFFTTNPQKIRERNLVTSEGRDFYCEYMTAQGMDRIGSKFYLVDMPSTGASLNSTLRTMRFYYEQFLRGNMPDIHFMGLGLPLEQDLTLPLYTYNARDGLITFNNLPDLGVRPLKIQTSPIYVNNRTLKNLLDQDSFQRAAVHGIEFPAERWTPEFNCDLQKGGHFHKEIYESLRSKIQMKLRTI